jgi:hypothetical protein
MVQGHVQLVAKSLIFRKFTSYHFVSMKLTTGVVPWVTFILPTL